LYPPGSNLRIIKDFSSIYLFFRHDSNSSPSKKTYSLLSVTLDDIIQNRLTPKHLLPNYPLLHDPIQPNLVSLIRALRQIDNPDELMLKAYSKIVNHEERTCCNYDGLNGKLPYPRHKRLLLDCIINLILTERNETLDDNDRHRLYTYCEKKNSTEPTLTKYRGLNIDHLDENNTSKDEKQFVCSLFQLVIPQDDIKRIILAKQDSSSQWNDNELCIYYSRPIHLLWIKQKWLERYLSNNEAQRWSQCIDWAMDSFLGKSSLCSIPSVPKVRPSKRKTMEVPSDHKRTKSSLTLQDKFKEIDRTKFNVSEYATKLIDLISDENKKNLPTFEQLQLLERIIFRFYWTSDQQKTWSQILDIIKNVFTIELKDNFRHFYAKQLLETNKDDQVEIQRLLQVVL
jgi:hypothetical protein